MTRADWSIQEKSALARYGLEECPAALIALSENATYAVESTPPTVLRLHRPGFRTRSQIESEVAWVEALRRDGVVRTPRTIADLDGALVTTVLATGGCALLMERASGSAPDESDVAVFAVLGEMTAHMHDHGAAYVARTAIDRPEFFLPQILGDECPYGHWSQGRDIPAEDRAVLSSVERLVRDRLGGAGGGGRTGLIHGDMRAANLLVDADGEVTVIDFDDCGVGWLLSDLACALSFLEADADTPARVAEWLGAYLAVRPQARDDIRFVPDLIVLRRLMLLAWLETRSHTAEAAALAATFVGDTVRLARAHLDGRFLAFVGDLEDS